jgi:hypothetical protein
MSLRLNRELDCQGKAMTRARVEEILKAKIVDVDTHERGGLGASNRGYQRGLFEALMLVKQIDKISQQP